LTLNLSIRSESY